MRMILFHGRSPADADPADAVGADERGGWGFDGPTLLGVTGIYATYGVSTFRVEFESGEYTRAARLLTGWEDWDENVLLVAWEDDLILTCEPEGFRYYGDWSIVRDETDEERASIYAKEALSSRYSIEPQYDDLRGEGADETHYVKCSDDRAEIFAVFKENRGIYGAELCIDWDLMEDFSTRQEAEQFIRGQMVLDKYLGRN